MHVPGFGSADASALALKAREIAVLKREEAAAVRFRYQQTTFFLSSYPNNILLSLQTSNHNLWFKSQLWCRLVSMPSMLDCVLWVAKNGILVVAIEFMIEVNSCLGPTEPMAWQS